MKTKLSIQISIYIFIVLHMIACSSLVVRQGDISTGVIDADHPYIQYIGRLDFSDPKNVQYDWPGVYICATFEGTNCSLRLSDSTNEYAVIIDQHAPKLLKTDTSKIYPVANNLNDSISHTIMIQKRTEAFIGKGGFCGFILDKGKKLLPPENRPIRRIEFIGNSITCGYGVEGDSTNCHFSVETENSCMSYAAMTARALHADYILVAYSGRGVVRNYGDPNRTSQYPMPSLYDRVCFSDSLHRWDFSKWVPHAVVINLGTNDFSTQPFPEKEVFQRAYQQLIHRVRSLYPDVTVFCVCGPMIEEPCMEYIKEIVHLEQKGGRNKDVFFIGIKRNDLADKDWGCDYHPNIYGMSKITERVVAEIRLRMNW